MDQNMEAAQIGNINASDQNLEAAQTRNINALYASIRSKPCILEDIDKDPFAETPLHVAASAGQTRFALEILILKPSFGRKLNLDGLSPLHLALQNKHFEMVKQLIKFDSKLIRVKGREGLTPLHYLAKTVDHNHLDLLHKFLSDCPASIEDLTTRNETVLHIALKNSSPEAFKVLLRWLRKTDNRDMLCLGDDEGNTVLHNAVSTSQPEIVKSLVKEMHTKDINAKNSAGLTALQMAGAKSEIKEILSRASTHKGELVHFFKSPYEWMEAIIGRCILEQRDLTLEMRNTILVVAVLIATCTFQAIIQPPGGVMRDTDTSPTTAASSDTRNINATVIATNSTNFFPTHFNATIFATTYTSAPDTDNPVEKRLFKNASMTYGSFFFDFYTLNTVCFLASVTAMIFVLPLTLSSVMLHISLLFLIVSYGISFYVISPSNSYAHTFFLASYIVFPCVYSLWISLSFILLLKPIRRHLVPYVLWKRIQMLRGVYIKSVEDVEESSYNQIKQSRSNIT